MSETKSKINPLIATAAVAVIIFSVVGVGVMTGVIPSSRSSNDAPNLAETNPAPEVKAAPAAEVKVPLASAPQPSAPVAHKRTPNPKPKQQPLEIAANERAPDAAPVPAPVARICTECGVIDTINVVDQKGSGSGLGAVGGAVVGGLLGNQVGAGRGNTVATVAGAVGGALAGNEVEKRVNSTKQYKVMVRMDDGNSRSFTFDSAPDYVVGEKVKIIDGRLVKR
jgi:outer membrane lipoprotein SlyB